MDPILEKVGEKVLEKTGEKILEKAWDKYKSKNETMSETQIEEEIAKICKRKGMYKFKSGGDLGYISSELTKIESKDRLPEEFKRENAEDRKAKLFRFLCQRGWKCGQENHGTCRVIFKMPDIYRRSR